MAVYLLWPPYFEGIIITCGPNDQHSVLTTKTDQMTDIAPYRVAYSRLETDQITDIAPYRVAYSRLETDAKRHFKSKDKEKDSAMNESLVSSR